MDRDSHERQDEEGRKSHQHTVAWSYRVEGAQETVMRRARLA